MPRPKKPNLTYKQERFVEELVKTGSPVAAVQRAYPSSTPKAQEVTSNRLLNNPRVRSAIDELIQEKYPDLDQDFMKLMRRQLERALAGDMKDKDVQAFAEFLAKIRGFYAPTESRKLVAKLSLPKE